MPLLLPEISAAPSSATTNTRPLQSLMTTASSYCPAEMMTCMQQLSKRTPSAKIRKVPPAFLASLKPLPWTKTDCPPYATLLVCEHFYLSGSSKATSKKLSHTHVRHSAVVLAMLACRPCQSELPITTNLK